MPDTQTQRPSAIGTNNHPHFAHNHQLLQLQSSIHVRQKETDRLRSYEIHVLLRYRPDRRLSTEPVAGKDLHVVMTRRKRVTHNDDLTMRIAAHTRTRLAFEERT